MIVECHDSNHNGDDAPGLGCGNPECWKHVPGKSSKPRPIRIPWCSCDFCATEVCPNCSSSDLAKIKGCIRCLKCGFKQDCNGW